MSAGLLISGGSRAPRPAGPSAPNTRWTYFVDFAVAVGYRGTESAKYSLRRLWLDGSLIYDAASNFRENDLGVSWTFYDGTQEQGDSLFATDNQIVGEDANGEFDMSDIRYPGMMYIVFRNLDLALTGLRYPKVTAEILGAPAKPAAEQIFASDPGSNGEYFATNFPRNLLYSRSSFDLRVFDIETLNTLQIREGFFHRPLQSIRFASYGSTFLMSNVFWLVPWLNMAIYKSGSNSNEFFFKDVDTGRLIGTIGSQSNALRSNLSNNTVLSPSNGLAVFDPQTSITYFVTNGILSGKNDVTVFDLRVDSVEYINVYPEIGNQYGSIVLMATGYTYGSVFIFYSSGAIVEFNIVSGVIREIYEPESSAFNFEPRGLFYDEYKEILVANYVSSSPSATLTVLYDAARGRVIAEVANEGNAHLWQQANNQVGPRYIYSNSSAGTFAPPASSSGTRPVINLTTGEIAQLPSGHVGVIWDSRDETFIGRDSGAMVRRFIVPYDGTDRVLLSTWLTDIGERLGFLRANIITENIDDTIIGSIVIDENNARRLLRDVCDFYRINMVETANGLRFTRREDTAAVSPVATLTRNDFVAAQDTEGAFVTRRVRPDDLPDRLQVWYLDRDADFNSVPFQLSRSIITSNAEQRLDLPLVLEKNDVAFYATAFLYETWTVSLRYAFAALPQHIRIEPGDFLIVTDDDYSDVARIESAVINGDWSISFEAVSVSSDLDLDFVTDETLRRDAGEALRTRETASIALVYDGPLPRPGIERENEVAQIIFGASSRNRGDNWSGCAVYRGSGTLSFALVGSFSDNPIWGRVIGSLGSHAPCATDNVNTLSVVMPEPSFAESVTLEASQDMVHICAVGSNDRWELLTFSEVTYANGIATFSGLTRGRLGTDQNVATHEEGEIFMYFGGESVISYLTPELIGEVIEHVALGFGQLSNNGARTETVVVGGSKRPYPPGDVRASLDGADIVFTWQRRDRLGYLLEGWQDDGAESLPLSEETETYILRIFDENETMVREIETTATTATYTEADQTADGFTYFDRVNIRLAQVSQLVGGGYFNRGQVNVAI